MFKKLNAFCFFILFISVSTAQKPVLVEKVDRKGNEIVIPYSKYKYPNGLTLIVHEDKSDPIVHVDVTYHVGSAREEIGKSGFAHFFEHMMFQGSDHVKDEEHFKIVTEAGGTMNGTTNMDRTNYFQTVPRNQLERVLWLEADRMGFLLDAVTQQKFEVQRATVKNERGQRYDNRPYGLVREKINQALYPYGHPYSWPTIGYLEDLNRVGVEDLKKFFLRWYGPNNAVITVAGDVVTADVVKLVEKYFGSVPAGPEVKPMAKQVPVIDKTRYISYEDNIRFPSVSINWPVVPAGHPDEAALDGLSYLLSHSKSSPFQQKFVKSGRAMSAYTYNFSQELSGVFGATLMLLPGNTLADAERTVLEILDEFSKRPVDKNDLQKFITSREVSSFRYFESVSNKASMLAYYETFFDNPNMIGKQLNNYRSLTPQAIQNVLNKYILNKPAVVLSVYPKGKPDLVAAADNFQPRLPDPTGSDPNLYGDLKYVKAKDNFDRSVMPPAGASPVVNIPALWNHNFEGKVRSTGITTNESPTVSAVLYFPAGHLYEPFEKAGLASLTAKMLNEGTQNSSSEELESRLESLGSTVRFSADEEMLTMSIFSLKKNLDSTIAIAKEMLFSPAFDEDDFNREKTKTLESINNRATQPSVIAETVFQKLVYGADDIRGLPVTGNLESVSSITLDDVRGYHIRLVEQSPPDLVVVGDITKDETVRKFDFLNRFVTPRPAQPELKATDNRRPKYYLVNRPGAAQSEIRMGYLSMPYDATGEYFRAVVMNYALGGAFNSRINLNLREDKGYTYGARSGFNGSTYPGPYRIATAVRTDATDSALIEILKELKAYRGDGITEDELKFTRSSMGESEALKYETPWQKAGFLNNIQKYNLSSDYTRRQQQILSTITTTEIRSLANKLLPVDDMIIVIVGDKEQFGTSLEESGIQFIELDPEGNPI